MVFILEAQFYYVKMAFKKKLCGKKLYFVLSFMIYFKK